MKRSEIWIAVCLASAPIAVADPIHPVAGGGYWHHDSGWIFPERIGEFLRVGIPQEVAGTPDAVAYYAREVDGVRLVASVDIFAADSAAALSTLSALPDTERSSAIKMQLDTSGALAASRVSHERALLYFVDTGAWRVRIQFQLPPDSSPDAAPLDAFVRGQRWDTLPR